MKEFTTTFNGEESRFIAGAIALGFDVEGEQSVDDFMCETLFNISPADIIKEATRYYEVKLGKDNYDREAMIEAMSNLITISKK